MTFDQEFFIGGGKPQVGRDVIVRRCPYILTLAAIVSFLMLAFLPPEAAAHGSDHPPALRNSRNQFVFLRPQKPAPMTPILAEDGSMMVLDRYRGKVILLNFWAT